MELIGLSGFARSGKDTVADILCEDFGFRRLAYADKLRDFLYAQNPIVRQTWTTRPTLDYVPTTIRLQQVIDAYGWDGYKESDFVYEIRPLIQRTGTEAGRGILGSNVWVDATLTGVGPDDKVVITDGRFYNELDALVDRGGYVWRVDRPGVGPANDHASENEATGYPRFSLRIDNNGTLDDLRDLVRREYLSGRYKEWSYS